ncbi:hypothetical protein GCM10008942_08900 [Rhizomicrobium electricum]|uniref:HTH cro/C1-type domain-containing protein n=2 Tax=Rhizomicrobium electricum TaxID=480070 RepID=A0ABP3PFQ4_9PROT|nr:transcriptional regulator with XRE-family HTH domain [Rhizomicrobium electricum]
MERSVSLAQLEKASGIPSNSINRIERGEAELTLSKMRSIGAALGVKPSELLVDADVEARPRCHLSECCNLTGTVAPSDKASLAQAAIAIITAAKHIAAGDASRAGSASDPSESSLAALWAKLGTDQRRRALMAMLIADVITE